MDYDTWRGLETGSAASLPTGTGDLGYNRVKQTILMGYNL